MKKPPLWAATILWVLMIVAAVGLWISIPSFKEEQTRWNAFGAELFIAILIVWLPSPLGPYAKEMNGED